MWYLNVPMVDLGRGIGLRLITADFVVRVCSGNKFVDLSVKLLFVLYYTARVNFLQNTFIKTYFRPQRMTNFFFFFYR